MAEPTADIVLAGSVTHATTDEALCRLLHLTEVLLFLLHPLHLSRTVLRRLHHLKQRDRFCSTRNVLNATALIQPDSFHFRICVCFFQST